MNQLTDDEWALVTKALVVGGLRQCIDEILENRNRIPLSSRNRRLIYTAYDTGDETITLHSAGDWVEGLWDGEVMAFFREEKGLLYSIVHDQCGTYSVIVGEGLNGNEFGVVFPTVGEAKAYIEGLLSK